MQQLVAFHELLGPLSDFSRTVLAKHLMRHFKDVLRDPVYSRGQLRYVGVLCILCIVVPPALVSFVVDAKLFLVRFATIFFH